MQSYHVFGGILRSELEFPELERAASGDPDWTLRISDEPADPSLKLESIGEAIVDQGVMVRASTTGDLFRLAYDDTGVFDVFDSGRAIRWHRPAGVDDEAARLDVLGRVLALALHASGWLSLHGSAVALERGAIAFLAGKGNGKSTLAFALMRAGAALMTDDTVVIGAGAPAIVRPGVQSVRLFQDSAELLDAQSPIPGRDTKATFAPPAATLRRDTRAPLAALYLLESVPAGSIAQPAERQRILGPAAVFGLLAQTKIGSLLGGSQSAAVFDAVVALAEGAEVYSLRVTRDYALLPAVVEQLAAWHAGVGAPELTTSIG
jgi:hypothetical protein